MLGMQGPTAPRTVPCLSFSMSPTLARRLTCHSISFRGHAERPSACVAWLAWACSHGRWWDPCFFYRLSSPPPSLLKVSPLALSRPHIPRLGRGKCRSAVFSGVSGFSGKACASWPALRAWWHCVPWCHWYPLRGLLVFMVTQQRPANRAKTALCVAGGTAPVVALGSLVPTLPLERYAVVVALKPFPATPARSFLQARPSPWRHRQVATTMQRGCFCSI